MSLNPYLSILISYHVKQVSVKFGSSITILLSNGLALKNLENQAMCAILDVWILQRYIWTPIKS